jgi:acetyl esterase
MRMVIRVDPQVSSLLADFARAGAPPLTAGTPAQARDRTRAMLAIVAPGPEMPSRDDLQAGVPVRRYEPEGAAGTLVYLHGGGWVVGDLDTADPTCRRLAAASGCEVVSVDYRRAPEHRYPAALEDAWAVVQWALDRPGPLTVYGESAGATLAAVCARRAPSIARQILVYPVCDHDFTRASYALSGFPITRAEMEWFWDHYVPDAARRDEPDASPLRAGDLSGLPPAVIVIAEHDPLRDEGLAYADRLRAAGVPVQVRHHHDLMHGFVAYQGLIDAAERELEALGDLIREDRCATASC